MSRPARPARDFRSFAVSPRIDEISGGPLTKPNTAPSTPQSTTIEDSDARQLARLYQARFSDTEIAAKDRVWKILCEDFFSRYVRRSDRVLDVAAGYCEFINHIECAYKVAFDANPD